MSEEQKTDLQKAHKILIVLKKYHYKARLVGGCVRDRLLGHEPKDYDVATDALPEEVIEALESEGIKVIPTGLDHGTVTAVLDETAFEITTLREDVATDGRRAVVKFSKSFEVDAARRDFTINALSEDLSGKVYDYFDGEEHLKKRELVFVGDSETRIQEDYLRILRLFRFQARFAFQFDEALLLVLKRNLCGLKKVSQERITSELEGLLKAPYPVQALKGLFEVGLMKQLLPFVTEKAKKNILTFTASIQKDPVAEPFLHLFSSFFVFSLGCDKDPSAGNKIDRECRRMRLSKLVQSQIESLVLGFRKVCDGFKDQADLLLFAKSCLKKSHEDFFRDVCIPFWMHMSTFSECCKQSQENLTGYLLTYMKNKDKLHTPPPLSARELMKLLSLEPGPELGKAMELQLRLYLNGEVLDKESVKKYLNVFSP